MKTTEELPLTLEDALSLLEVKEVPGGPELSGLMIGGLQSFIERHGVDWVRQHRVRLVEELELLAEL
jgi:hypothetical protein